MRSEIRKSYQSAISFLKPQYFVKILSCVTAGPNKIAIADIRFDQCSIKYTCMSNG